MTDSNVYSFFHTKAVNKRTLSDKEETTFLKDVYLTDQRGMELMFFLIYVYSNTQFNSKKIPYDGNCQLSKASYTWDFDTFPLLLKKILVVAMKAHKKSQRQSSS